MELNKSYAVIADACIHEMKYPLFLSLIMFRWMYVCEFVLLVKL